MTAPVTELPPEWVVDLADCPNDSVESMLRFSLSYAVLAPSTHNAQPWRFRIEDGHIDVSFDTARGLPVTDPQDREGVISVAAAALNLRVALARLDLGCTWQLWPDPHDPECILRVFADTRHPVEKPLSDLLEAITQRCTAHGRFDEAPLPAGVIASLGREAAEEGAALFVATDAPSKAAIAAVVAEADRRQSADASFRRELASWLRVSAQSRDGIHGFRVDGSPMPMLAPLVVRTFDIGAGRAAHDAEIATLSPALALLTTPGDERNDWVTAGFALERVLLRATTLGVGVGFLNQPIELGNMRVRLADTFAATGSPQVLMRFGTGVPTQHQRRRDVVDVSAR